VLGRGDSVPHFEVTTIDGRTIRYSTIWQHRNLVLIALPEADVAAAEHYLSALAPLRSDALAQHTGLIVTREPVEGMPVPGVLVADQWGEIACVASAPDTTALPPAHELIEWIEHVRNRCPECEGEAK
jgi:peroxiredoxin